MVIVYDDKTDWVSDKRETTNRKATQLSNANSMDIGNEAHGFDSNAFKARHLESSTDKDNADEEKILRIFGKMLPLIEEFDNLLLDIPHAERIDAVAQIIISSLMSSNPFKAMENAINFQKSIAGMKKASYFIAGWKKILPIQAQGLLRTAILNAPYFKTKLNYSINNNNN
jgi:hypothetical protein